MDISLDQSSFDDDSSWRVKVYLLNSDNQWEDCGMGMVKCTFVDDFQAPALVVTSELTNDIILQSKIRKEEIYESQGATIIMWTEDDSSHFAISFEQETGCKAIWSAIGLVQHSYYSNKPAMFGFVDSVGGLSSEDDLRSNVLLPDPSKDTILRIRDILTSISVLQKHNVAHQLLADDAKYIRSLWTFFHALENEENYMEINRPYFIALVDIMKNILYFNEDSIIMLCLEDENIVEVASIMEYSPIFSSKGNFRDFIREGCVLHQVVPITSPSLKTLIQQLFRLKFLKDTWLRPVLDDPGCSSIKHMIVRHSSTIATMVFLDTEYVRKILVAMRQDNPDTNQRASAFLFFRELIQLSKFIDFLKTRLDCYAKFIAESHDLFSQVLLETLIPALDSNGNPLNTLRLYTVSRVEVDVDVIMSEVFCFFCSCCPHEVWDYMLYSQELPHLPPAFQVPSTSSITATFHTYNSTTSTCSNLGEEQSSCSGLSNNSATWTMSSLTHNRKILLFVLIEALSSHPQSVVLENCQEALKYILDMAQHSATLSGASSSLSSSLSTSSASSSTSTKSTVLEYFFTNFFPWMVFPFMDENTAPPLHYLLPVRHFPLNSFPAGGIRNVGGSESDSSSNPPWFQPSSSGPWVTSRRLLLELFTSYVDFHQMKYFIVRREVFRYLLRLLKSPLNRLLHVDILKLFKAVFLLQDSFYESHLSKWKLLESLVDFTAHYVEAKADNLVTAALADLWNTMALVCPLPFLKYVLDLFQRPLSHLRSLPFSWILTKDSVDPDENSTRVDSNISSSTSISSSSNDLTDTVPSMPRVFAGRPKHWGKGDTTFLDLNHREIDRDVELSMKGLRASLLSFVTPLECALNNFYESIEEMKNRGILRRKVLSEKKKKILLGENRLKEDIEFETASAKIKDDMLEKRKNRKMESDVDDVALKKKIRYQDQDEDESYFEDMENEYDIVVSDTSALPKQEDVDTDNTFIAFSSKNKKKQFATDDKKFEKKQRRLLIEEDSYPRRSDQCFEEDGEDDHESESGSESEETTASESDTESDTESDNDSENEEENEDEHEIIRRRNRDLADSYASVNVKIPKNKSAELDILADFYGDFDDNNEKDKEKTVVVEEWKRNENLVARSDDLAGNSSFNNYRMANDSSNDNAIIEAEPPHMEDDNVAKLDVINTKGQPSESTNPRNDLIPRTNSSDDGDSDDDDDGWKPPPSRPSSDQSDASDDEFHRHLPRKRLLVPSVSESEGSGSESDESSSPCSTKGLSSTVSFQLSKKKLRKYF